MRRPGASGVVSQPAISSSHDLTLALRASDTAEQALPSLTLGENVSVSKP